MNWIQIGREWINLDLVTRVKPHRREDGTTAEDTMTVTFERGHNVEIPKGHTEALLARLRSSAADAACPRPEGRRGPQAT